MNAFEIGGGSGTLVEQAVGSNPVTTRAALGARLAAGWLALNPEVTVTRGDLSKTLQQFFTEVFMTGQQRGRVDLSPYAGSLLDAAAVDRREFSAARTFSKSADMPARYAVMFARLGVLLAPLAAAVQLARTPVADSARELIERSRVRVHVSRPELRGFVVARVRRLAESVHARAGFGKSAHEYLGMILTERDALAATVVAGAKARRAQRTEMDQRGRERLEEYLVAHGAQLTAAARKYGPDGEDILADVLLKLVVAFRNNPDLDASLGFGLRALANAAAAYYDRRRRHWNDEAPATDDLESLGGAGEDHLAGLVIADAVLRTVLRAAEALSQMDCDEAPLARWSLLEYFLLDPRELNPRRAQMAPRVLDLAIGGTGKRGDEVQAGVAEIATSLAPSRAAAARASALAMTVLRGGRG